jgi:gliding-associated putative ABC transporter substrate-binding component GldG
MKRNNILAVFLAIAGLILFNSLASVLYTRVDMTEDHRYTLSGPALKTVENFTEEVVVDVLLGGKLPAEFEKLKVETRQLLEEFRAANNNIRINFVDPLEGEEEPEAVMANLQGLGLNPVNVTVEDKGSFSQELVFPWAMVNYNNTTVKVPLLKNNLGSTSGERINNSVQNLEYAFSDAFTKLGLREKKQVAVIKGNGELEDIYIADYLSTIRDYYNIGAITLDSVAANPQKVLDQLRGFDLALIVKPTEAFTEEEKYVLDQFMVAGGKTIWLIDKVAMELDSLFNERGTAIAIGRNLNLDDLLFRYGIRINPVLVNDLYFTQIVLAAGEGNSATYDPVPWYYHPMVFSDNNHPINTNTEAIKFQFANTIDTLANPYRKTIIYHSSPLSKTEGVPKFIGLEMIQTPPERETYTRGNQPMAVLVEGSFRSAYNNRVKPLDLDGTLEQGPPNKMLVVADGDVVRNQLRKGRPLELGYDQWTNNFYGNKEFMVNAINYLLDDTGLIRIRTRNIEIPLLDQEKIRIQRAKWQLINIVVPIVSILIFGWLFNAIRRRKYGH